MADRLAERFETRVRVDATGKGRGKVIIEFAGLLPGGNTALIYAAGSAATSPRAAFYTVPLDGSARTQAFALPDGAFYAPVTVP